MLNLEDYVDNLKGRVNPPGVDLYPDATDDTWLLALTNAFWEIRLHGMLAKWEEDAAARGGPSEFGEGIITPVGETDVTYDDDTGYASTDIPRELVQLIILWAAWKNALTAFQELKATFRAKAGDVEFEEQNAPTLLKDILDQLYAEIKEIIWNLSTYGFSTTAAVYDSIIERDYSQAYGDVWWVR